MFPPPAALRLTLPAVLAMTAPALAHHPMGGATPTTVWQGLLSGFGHPVLGLDHLAALIVVGLLASRIGPRWFLLPGLWIAAMGAGALAHLGRIDLPGAEILVAGSLVAIALAAALRPGLPLIATGLLFAVGGFSHGHALAESIVGAEPMPMLAYLTGLVIVQGAVATGVAFAARRLFPQTGAPPVAFRAASGAMAAVGLAFLVLAVRALA